MTRMKLRTKAILLALLCVVTIAFFTSCKSEVIPYETNNADNYTVSVKYDANGGIFTTNTSVIVDSFNISELPENSDGNVEIALISPDDKNRGNDAFTAINNGHFLAGWYSERIESTDAEGNKIYSYSNKWDFENDVFEVAADGEYKSEQPEMTLYAAWVPMFEIEFYSMDSGEYISNYVFDPTTTESISVPAWDEETGIIDMFNFPARSGYTFSKAFYDADGKNAVDTDFVNHPGVVNYETGTAENAVLKLYVEWLEGEWYHIYNAEQFLDNASVNGSYEIHADLDFADEIWPTAFMYGNFTGEIKGNGHVLKNIELTQTNNSKVNAGLFGYLTDTAKISDLTLENVTFTIKSGTRVVGTSYGLFAGTISNDTLLENVNIKDSTLQINTSCYFGVEDYSIGLVCGMGNSEMVESADIDCIVVGDNPESLNVTVNGNTVAIDFVTE